MKINHPRTHELGLKHGNKLLAVKKLDDDDRVIYETYAVNEKRDVAYKLNFSVEYHYPDSRKCSERLRGKFKIYMSAYDSMLECMQFIYDLVEAKMLIEEDEYIERLIDRTLGSIYAVEKSMSVQKVLEETE